MHLLKRDLGKNEIRYISSETGQKIKNMKFGGIKQLLLELKEFGEISGHVTTALDFQSQLGICKRANRVI